MVDITRQMKDGRGSYKRAERQDTYIEKPSIYTCAWAGCNHQGVISESTTGGSFYCREHARQVIGWYN